MFADWKNFREHVFEKCYYTANNGLHDTKNIGTRSRDERLTVLHVM